MDLHVAYVGGPLDGHAVTLSGAVDTDHQVETGTSD